MVERGGPFAKVERAGNLPRFFTYTLEFRVTDRFWALCGDGLVTHPAGYGGEAGGETDASSSPLPGDR